MIEGSADSPPYLPCGMAEKLHFQVIATAMPLVEAIHVSGDMRLKVQGGTVQIM